jgi:cobalt-zinc-cadmium efflux system protein
VHKHNTKLQGKRLFLSIALNLLITIGQLIGGYISGSMALISDALHNFSDVLALGLSYLALRLSTKNPNVHQTFGFKRAEIIAAFINASALIVIAVFLCSEAIKRFSEPQVIESGWVIAMASFSILINGISVALLHKDSKQSMNIRSSYIHLMTDMFTSVAVLIGGIIMHYYSVYWIDGVLTLIIAIYLIFATWNILINSLKVLMLFVPSEIVLEEINRRISSFPEITNIHHVHVWQLTDKQTHFEAHVDFDKNLELSKVNEVLAGIKKILYNEFHIKHVTLQPEYNTCDEKELVAKH